MGWNNPAKSVPTIGQLLTQIQTSGKLSYVQYLRLMSAILSGNQITDTERHQINRIFDHVQTGRITLIQN